MLPKQNPVNKLSEIRMGREINILKKMPTL